MNKIAEQLKLDIIYWKNLSEEMRREFKALPIGSVVGKNIKGKTYLYHQYRDHNKQKFEYIKNNNDEFIEKIIRKAFIKKSLPIIEHNIQVIEKAINNFMEYNPQIICKELESLNSRKYLNASTIDENKLLSNYKGNEIKVKKWLKEEICVNPIYIEELKHTTRNGIKVRSKSEMIIAGMLESRGIAFKYEDPIKIDGIMFRPDFAIMRSSDLKIIYWEHFGLTGDRDYVNGMAEKLQIFAQHGITLWDNLIVTFDTPQGSIDGHRINQIMDLYRL